MHKNGENGTNASVVAMNQNGGEYEKHSIDMVTGPLDYRQFYLCFYTDNVSTNRYQNDCGKDALSSAQTNVLAEAS